MEGSIVWPESSAFLSKPSVIDHFGLHACDSPSEPFARLSDWCYEARHYAALCK